VAEVDWLVPEVEIALELAIQPLMAQTQAGQLQGQVILTGEEGSLLLAGRRVLVEGQDEEM
jgi:hypothetical protein